MDAEAAHVSDQASASAPTVSSCPAVARQAADALRWFFACDEGGSSRPGPQDGGSRGQSTTSGSPYPTRSS